MIIFQTDQCFQSILIDYQSFNFAEKLIWSFSMIFMLFWSSFSKLFIAKSYFFFNKFKNYTKFVIFWYFKILKFSQFCHLTISSKFFCAPVKHSKVVFSDLFHWWNIQKYAFFYKICIFCFIQWTKNQSNFKRY